MTLITLSLNLRFDRWQRRVWIRHGIVVNVLVALRINVHPNNRQRRLIDHRVVVAAVVVVVVVVGVDEVVVVERRVAVGRRGNAARHDGRQLGHRNRRLLERRLFATKNVNREQRSFL